MAFIFTAVKPASTLALRRASAQLGRLVAADPGVHPGPIPHGAAEQGVDGHAEGLPAMSQSAWSRPATALERIGPPR